MKILFITNDFIIDPLGIMYLSAALKNAGHKVAIIKTVYKDYERYALVASKHYPNEVVNYEAQIIVKIKEYAPDIIAYSVTTGMHSYYLRINRLIKDHLEFYSVFGGPHPTFFPDIIYKEGVDAICMGEGEEAFVEFIDQLSSHKDVRKIRNFWVKENNIVYKNNFRPLIDNPDRIIFPDREIVYNFESSYKNPIKNFIIGRGCPYDCTYCFNHAYSALYKDMGQRVRLRTPENVISEVESVIKIYPLEIVYFQDDVFVLSKKWLEDFLPTYIKRINLPYHCHLRANLITEDLLRMLKESGCLSVTLALESGNDRIRNEVLQRGMSKEQIYSACGLLRRFKIKFRTENMIGLPGEDIITALETLKMNIKCKPDIGWASLYQPYPNTVLGEKCYKLGLYDGNIDSIKPSFFEKSILNLKDKVKIENLQKFFSILVEFPFLLPLALLAINLPPNKVFNQIYTKWKKYCYTNRLYKTKKYKIKYSPINCFLYSNVKKGLLFFLHILIKLDIFSIPRFFLRKQLLILAYHGISADEKHKIPTNFDYKNVPLLEFKKQMAYLKRHYNILPLNQIIKNIKNNIPLPNNTLAITFDDGYESVYRHGLETIKKNNIPATLFLVSGLIATNKIGWYDQIETAIDFATTNSKEKKFTFENSFLINLSDPIAAINTTSTIKEALRKIGSEQREVIKNKLLAKLERAPGFKNSYYSQLSLCQIEELKKYNFEFGSHTVNHESLPSLTLEKIKFELTESRDYLEDKLNCNIILVSYPYGEHIHDTERIVRESGYLAAVTTEYGYNTVKDSLFKLKRIGITGNFSFEYFICWLFPQIKSIADKLLKIK